MNETTGAGKQKVKPSFTEGANVQTNKEAKDAIAAIMRGIIESNDRYTRNRHIRFDVVQNELNEIVDSVWKQNETELTQLRAFYGTHFSPSDNSDPGELTVSDMCKWTRYYPDQKTNDVMRTGCGDATVYGTSFKFCHFCGRKIEVSE